MHRIGGIEKEDGSGNVSYDSDNHERMVRPPGRQGRGDRGRHPARSTSTGPDDADLLVLGWGSTWGAIDGAVNRVRANGHKVAKAHLTHLSPFPRNLGEVVRRHPRVLIPEMNLGQLSDSCERSSWSTRGPSPRCGECPSRQASSSRPSSRTSEPTLMTDLIPVTSRKDWIERPGGSVVPWLR